ncbi:MAG: hypothetical protein R6U52_09420 [Kosmotogaceae bacterium]
MKKSILIYYIAAISVQYSVNLFAYFFDWLLILFPLAVIPAYLLATGKLMFSSRDKKLISDFIEGRGTVYEELEKELRFSFQGKSYVNDEKYKKLKNWVVETENRIRKAAIFQRKLYIISIFIAPVFPILSSISALYQHGIKELITLIIGHGAMYAIIIMAIMGFKNLLKNIERLKKELRDVIEQNFK